MKKFEGHIFDLDGTLANSMGHWASAMIAVLDEAGASYPADIIKIITPMGSKKTAEYFSELGVPGTSEEIIDKIYSKLLPLYRDVISQKDGACEYVKKLKDEGCKLYVLTASPHLLADPCLLRFGIYGLFDRVFTTDDMNMPKSDPAIYTKLCDTVGIDISNSVFYDDNMEVLTALSKTPMLAVGIYDESSDEYTEEIKKISDKYINSFTELL